MIASKVAARGVKLRAARVMYIACRATIIGGNAHQTAFLVQSLFQLEALQLQTRKKGTRETALLRTRVHRRMQRGLTDDTHLAPLLGDIALDHHALRKPRVVSVHASELCCCGGGLPGGARPGTASLKLPCAHLGL